MKGLARVNAEMGTKSQKSVRGFTTAKDGNGIIRRESGRNKMFENEWTKKIKELKANNLILFTENEQLKTVNAQAAEIIIQLRKERNYWHGLATQGGGHG